MNAASPLIAASPNGVPHDVIRAKAGSAARINIVKYFIFLNLSIAFPCKILFQPVQAVNIIPVFAIIFIIVKNNL